MELVKRRAPNNQRFRKLFKGMDAGETPSSDGVLSPSLASMYLARGCDSGSALLYIFQFDVRFMYVLNEYVAEILGIGGLAQLDQILVGNGLWNKRHE